MIFLSHINGEHDIAIWRALANPARRRMLDLLAKEPLTVSGLGASFPKLSRFAVMQHLGVLVSARLVLVRPKGRERWNYLNAAPLHEIYTRWVDRLADRMAASAHALKTLVERSTSMPVKTTENLRTLELHLEYPINATPKQVWKVMMDQSSRWWQEAKFFARKDAIAFHIEPVPGGRLWEETETGGGVLWWTISAIDPPKTLTLVGPMSSASELAMEQVRIELVPEGKGCTLKLRDQFLGQIEDLKKHEAVFTEGWGQLMNALKRLCENGAAK